MTKPGDYLTENNHEKQSSLNQAEASNSQFMPQLSHIERSEDF